MPEHDYAVISGMKAAIDSNYFRDDSITFLESRSHIPLVLPIKGLYSFFEEGNPVWLLPIDPNTALLFIHNSVIVPSRIELTVGYRNNSGVQRAFHSGVLREGTEVLLNTVEIHEVGNDRGIRFYSDDTILDSGITAGTVDCHYHFKYLSQRQVGLLLCGVTFRNSSDTSYQLFRIKPRRMRSC